MIPDLESCRDRIETLCRANHVARLEVFGSAVTNQFDPSRSDVDFLVTFQSLDPARHSRSYFGLREGLEDLLLRPIDLVEVEAVTNPFFLAAIRNQRRTVYAA